MQGSVQYAARLTLLVACSIFFFVLIHSLRIAQSINAILLSEYILFILFAGFLQLLPASTEVDTVVGWVKTFVAQLLAKRALEKYCLTLPTDEQICFNIIATDRSKLCYASWSVMEDVIKTVMASSEAIGLTSDMPPDVIGILKDRILASNSHNKVIRAFKALLESKDPGWFPSGLHCEFILGAFLLYPQLANPTDDKLLLSITEVLWSRPCFPH